MSDPVQGPGLSSPIKYEASSDPKSSKVDHIRSPSLLLGAHALNPVRKGQSKPQQTKQATCGTLNATPGKSHMGVSENRGP